MKTAKWLSVLLAVTLAVFFLSASITVPILFRPYYEAQIDALGLVSQTGWDVATIREAYHDVMDFLVWGAPFDTGTLQWSASGQAHFADCQRLFRFNFVLLGSSAILLLLFGWMHRKRHIRFPRLLDRSPAFWAAAGMCILLLAAAAWAAIDFDSLFRIFHQALFPGETNWLFDPQTDEIILILPEAFWMHTGALVIILSLSSAVLTAAATEWLHRHCCLAEKHRL